MAAFTATPYSFLQTFRNFVWFQILLGWRLLKYRNLQLVLRKLQCQCRLFS